LQLGGRRSVWAPASTSGGECLDRHREKLGELAKVLGGGGEEELVSGPFGTSKAKPVELQDALEVREQHLDLLPLTPGGDVGFAFREIPCQITSAFVDRTGNFASRLPRAALLLERTGPAIPLTGPVAHEAVLIDDGTRC